MLQYAGADAPARKANCMAHCAVMPEGTVEQLAGTGNANTRACRIYHQRTAAAQSQQATHCPHAGPSGGGMCEDSGDNASGSCEHYCDSVMFYCDDPRYVQYVDRAQCLTSCTSMPAGTGTETSGNSLACRQYHVIAGAVASNDTPGALRTHCPHTGPTGGNVCGSPCDHYCDLQETACGFDVLDLNRVYTSKAECLTQCASDIIYKGYPAATEGDTLECRTYHASAAVNAPGTHCAHTAAVSSTCTGAPVVASSCNTGDYLTTGDSVALAGFAYVPKCLKVTPGASVTIEANGTHPVQAQYPWSALLDNPFATGNGAGTSPGSDTSLTRTLTTPGIYPYYCTNHGQPEGTNMAGSIWVSP